jgi:hypothetical protein
MTGWSCAQKEALEFYIKYGPKDGNIPKEFPEIKTLSVDNPSIKLDHKLPNSVENYFLRRGFKLEQIQIEHDEWVISIYLTKREGIHPHWDYLEDFIKN